MAIRKLTTLSLLIAGVALRAQPPAAAQPPAEITRTQLAYTLAHYTKYEYRIPMRDGVRLFAAVYAPKDETQAYPIILMRTPYSVGPYGADNYKPQVGPSYAAEKEGFIFVYEDVRGRYMSEGSLSTFARTRPITTARQIPTRAQTPTTPSTGL
jgi:predicted acyl esterase